MTKKLQTPIEQARSYNGKAVVIELQNANYNIHKENSSQILYHISNTASEKENPNQTKHIDYLAQLVTSRRTSQSDRTRTEPTPFRLR